MMRKVLRSLCIVYCTVHNIVCFGFTHTNYWFPIVPISSYKFENPSKVTVLNKEFVVWKRNEHEFVVQDDKCPHRCAPLSEGYIDRVSGNLRCSYHGWEFNKNGFVQCLPQSKTPYAYSGNNRLSVQTYDTCVYGDILWAFLGNKSAENSEYVNGHPFSLQLIDGMTTMMREVPYDYFILLENLFDPAHVPFAHHKLQSTRDKGCPVQITVTCANSTGFSVLFTDKAMNRNGEDVRTGTMNLKFPCHYYLEALYPKNGLLERLHVFTVPVKKGKSRILIQTEYNKRHILYNIIRRIPEWIKHVLTNKFFDSDTLLLHEQERLLMEHRTEIDDFTVQYNLMTESDTSISRYSRWIKQVNGFRLPYFGKHLYEKKKDGDNVNRKSILNRYEQHTKRCVHCSKALTVVERIQGYGGWIGVIVSFFLDEPIYAIIGGVQWIVMERIREMLIFEDYIHNQVD